METENTVGLLHESWSGFSEKMSN